MSPYSRKDGTVERIDFLCDMPLQVLVVDDDVHVLRHFQKYFAQHNTLTVRTSDNPETALRLMEERYFDVAVVDYSMIQMNGFEFVEAFRKQNHLRHVAPILFTGHSDALTIARVVDSSFYTFVEKDADFLQRIESAILKLKNSENRYANQMRWFLHKALANDEFCAVYQPIYHLRSKKVAAYEALSRWCLPNPASGAVRTIAPLTYIPYAEEFGFIADMDLAMLGKVSRDQQRWAEEDGESVPVSVNFSALTFSRENLAEEVRRVIRQNGGDPALLGIEFTESRKIPDLERFQFQLKQLTEIGLRIIMDDYGSDYASANVLMTVIPYVSSIKIDRVLVYGILEHGQNHRFVAHTIRYLKNLRADSCNIVLEYVADEHILEEMTRIDPDLYFQGYAIDQPLSSEEGRLRRQNSARHYAAVTGQIASFQIQHTLNSDSSMKLHAQADAPRLYSDGPIRLLIIDDEPMVRTMLRIKFQHLGYTVCEANSGTDGWVRYLEFQPRVLIVDQQMETDTAGSALTARIREHEKKVGAEPGLICAHTSEKSARSEFQTAGADLFFLKSQSLSEKIEYLKTIVSVDDQAPGLDRLNAWLLEFQANDALLDSQDSTRSSALPDRDALRPHPQSPGLLNILKDTHLSPDTRLKIFALLMEEQA
ncbi:MAG: EAL domain-containing protein [Leptospiraceae bacterium]|nr:EAL domain-containing protein [Leptospiraceae bacterium]